MINPRIAIAACILALTAAATAAVPIQTADSFSLDLSPFHRTSTQPTPHAGTYAAADPHPTHRHTNSANHRHTL